MRWTMRALAALLCVTGCKAPPSQPAGTPEQQLRRSLSIPDDAQTVIVFGQNAHLDIDWQKTFDDYYEQWVGDIFVQARQIVEQQPRAFYSVAEMGYLQRHVAEHPEELAPLQAAARRGALRIVGGGMTSPDTLLPETELLARDFLYGAAFAQDSFGITPRVAWLPDSFGHSGTAPDLLAAAGFTGVALGRLDGTLTFFELLKPNPAPLTPGSNAAMLSALGTADFVWRGTGGGKVLAHYLGAGLYCLGDNIDYDELITLPNTHIGNYEGDDPSYTDGKIDQYAASLRPWAKTPYLFVPVGCDFQQPKPELIGYLDGYNQRRRPTTGLYAVAASFEDYEKLVAFHASELPELAADFTPYFMGFYASRDDLKSGTRAAMRPFVAAEELAALLGEAGAAAMKLVSPDLSRLTLADHHDFVTGTSTDAVVQDEQEPLLASAQAAGQGAFESIAESIAARIPATVSGARRVIAWNPAALARDEVAQVTWGALPSAARTATAFHAEYAGQPLPTEITTAPIDGQRIAVTARFALAGMEPLGYRAIDLVPGLVPGALPPPATVTLSLLDAQGNPATGAAVARVVLQNEHARVEWARSPGFAMVSLVLDGQEQLAGPSFVLHDYTDQGGLWRLGNEMAGCALTALPALDGSGDTVEVIDGGGLAAHVLFRSLDATREVELDAGARGPSLTLTTGAGMAQTRTATFAFANAAGATLRTSQAGGFVERKATGLYTPTFWPAVEWASQGGVALLLRQSTGVHFDGLGTVELMAARDARTEVCDVEGGTGSDTGTHRIEWRIEAAATPAAAAQAASEWNRPIATSALLAPGAANGDLATAAHLLDATGDGIVSTVKPADRGAGVIVRVLLLPGPVTLTLQPPLAGAHLYRTDTSERDLEDLGPAAATVTLDSAHYGSIATLRLAP